MRAIRSIGSVVFAVVAALGLVASPAGAGRETVTLHAGLAGAREVPGPGDKNGSGVAHVEVDPVSGSICYRLTVRNIAPAAAAHIHDGERDEAGPIVQHLNAPSDGSSSGCVTNSELASALAEEPSAFYVNVHNAEHRAGAVRGQLAGG